jgi:hypothetical protein
MEKSETAPAAAEEIEKGEYAAVTTTPDAV